MVGSYLSIVLLIVGYNVFFVNYCKLFGSLVWALLSNFDSKGVTVNPGFNWPGFN